MITSRIICSQRHRLQRQAQPYRRKTKYGPVKALWRSGEGGMARKRGGHDVLHGVVWNVARKRADGRGPAKPLVVGQGGRGR